MRQSARARARRAEHAELMEELRPLVFMRDGWRCVRCGIVEGEWRDGFPIPLEAHHRLMRSQGGPDTMENLVTLCGPNPTGCHGWVHHAGQSAARTLGLLLPRSGGPPAEAWGGSPLDEAGPRF